jgi:hypothetical protein
MKLYLLGKELRRDENAPIPLLTSRTAVLANDVMEAGNYLGEYAVNPTNAILQEFFYYDVAATNASKTLTSLIERDE